LSSPLTPFVFVERLLEAEEPIWHCYLTKAPEPVLYHEWRLRDRKPGWQMRLLDRRLFAPTQVRPGPIVENIQSVDFDLRLEDQFSRRGV
jgi:hypothetical protein